MKEYSYVTRKAMAAAAALEAFEAAYMGIIEGSETTPTMEERDRAVEMFYLAYDSALESSAALNGCMRNIEVVELYNRANEGDKRVIQCILGKYKE